MWRAISETREEELLVVANAYKPGAFYSAASET
jgi:hypothetical protein